MKRRQNLFKQEQGFTLIELMAVLAILTMLVLIAVPAIGSITKKAEAQADDATISMIEKAGGLALLGDVAYDDPVEEQYEVATLVEEGYLDIDAGHKYAGSGNAVTHIKGYEFEFGGQPTPEQTPEESTPEPAEPTTPTPVEPAEPTVEEKQIGIANAFLNDPSHYFNRNVDRGIDSYDGGNKYAWLIEPLAIDLPTGEYTMTLLSTIAGNEYLRLITYDAEGNQLGQYGSSTTFDFTITDDVDTVMIRLHHTSSSSKLLVFNSAWIGKEVNIRVAQK